MENTFEVLELPKILDRLARHTSFSASQELALSLMPSADEHEVSLRQRATTEAKRFLDMKPTASLAGARDVREVAHRAGLGGMLEPRELLDVLATLVSARTIKGMLSRLVNQLPLLAVTSERITLASDLEGEIQRCLNPQGDVLDSASPVLRRLRAEVQVVHRRLLDRLESLANDPGYRQVIQDPIVTLRQGRYVIPVKADFKGQFRGIIHDQSASGATVFVEPLETVGINNRWRELQLEEQREIQRILRELSALVGDLEEALSETVEALAEIDLALAKARYSVEIDAIQPLLVEASLPPHRVILDLVNARHPLLGGEAVPISLHLGGEFFVLVITGPNTGGKTVALKTVGLLTLMAQCGLHIPADEGSKVRVLDSVYADIGDEQSIEQSLSTFSSHLSRVIDVLKKADAQSLVLLDEIGAGTDPMEGSALARALLTHLVQRNVPTIATTHYSELKAYAHATPGVENACVEFDAETLAPTYKLSIGLPGRSNALAIAQRLGVPSEVTDAAAKLVSSSETQVDQLLKQIQTERDRAGEERAGAEAARREAARLSDEIEKRLDNIERERGAILDQARRDADALVAEVRQQLREIAAPVERIPAGRDKLFAAMSGLKAVQQEIEKKQLAEAEAESKLREARPGHGIRAGSQSRSGPQGDLELSRRPLGLGDYVLVKSLGQYGELLSLPDSRGEAEVQLGSFKVKVRARDIERATSPPKVAYDYYPSYQVSIEDRSRTRPEIEVRGWRVDQVLPELERYLNDAYLAGYQTVRIIHGKGTGVLRQVVREQLTQHPLVRSFEMADIRDGGEGVTVATLAN